MDMKKILQAMDGIATKPVEGADSMAKFLRVVKEAEINQPQVPVAPTAPNAPDEKPTPIPAMPDISGLQPGGDSKDLGHGEAVKIGADGNIQYMGGWGTYVYNPQGQHISTMSPTFAGYQQTTDAQGKVTSQRYNQGDIDITKGPEGTQTSYQLGPDKLTHATDAQGNVKNSVNGQSVQENSLSKFLSIVDKNNVSILKEGTNPHKVSLPVQMAMQHYQHPTEKLQPRARLIDKYFVEAETEIMQRREEKRALINQYAKTIAERVLMKESVQGVLEGDVPADPNKLTASMLMGGEYKELDLTPLIVKNNWVGTPKQVINQADKWLSDFLRQRGNMYSNLKIKYKGLTMTSSKIGDVDAPDLEFESMVEAPIEMTGDANDPHIYGHQKANPMSLKGRIGQARAQLKELAELAESDSLLAWEEICKKAKGGMFMGLEQNLEQIRHGISELAAKRRKGGVQSRGINPHIGEQGTSPVVNKVANTLVSAGANARQAIDKAVSSIPKPFDEKEVANDLKSGQAASVTKKK
jgi:hypothetical protein